MKNIHIQGMGTLATRLAEIQQGLGARGTWHVANEKTSATRHLPPVTLIAASKTVPTEVLEEAIALGITDFGENKVQEAQAKWPALQAKYPHVRLHLIGPLQSNKAKEALELFDVIHTVDREKLVDALVRHQSPATRRQFLIQVNTGEEPQKAGVLPKDLPALINYCRTLTPDPLSLSGLMCIPPVGNPAAPHFALLRKLADRHDLAECSMGMSSDYALAASLGATMVRVGTALFGERV